MNWIKPIAIVSLCVGSTLVNASDYKVETFPPICAAIEDERNYDTEFLRKHWKILKGKQQWLANTSMDFPTYTEVATPFALQELNRLKALLADYGTELMVVYLPARGLTYPDELAANAINYDVKSARTHYLDALESIRQQSIVVPQLGQLFNSDPDSPLFYEKDIHWSIEGAKATAQIIAGEIDKLGLADLDSERKYETTYNGMMRDVANVEQAIAQICDSSYAPTYSPTYVTTEIASEDEGDAFTLFDEVSDDIVLLGTSFSALSKFNFNGYIQEYANVPVANYALSGGGLIGSWINYLKSGDFQASPPQLIVWEVPGWREFEPRFFHSFMPLFFEACDANSAVMASDPLPVTTRKVQNALFRATGTQETAKDLMIELNFDSPHVDAVQVRVWFANGASRTYNMRHQYRTANDGRFLTTLGNDHNYPDEKVVGVDIESIKYFSSAGERPKANVTLSLCPNPIPYSD